MPETAPILLAIHNQFDHYLRNPDTDHSVISDVAINATAVDYRVTTYPGGTGTNFDAFNIDVNTPLFGGGNPTRVETSRGDSNTMTLEIDPERTVIHEETGLVSIGGNDIDAMPRVEKLILPEDPEFYMFLQLHERFQAVLPLLSSALEPISPELIPETFSLSNRVGTVIYDHENKISTHRRNTVVEAVGSEGQVSVHVKLDASTQTPLWADAEPTLSYKFGEAYVQVGEQVGLLVLDEASMVAFSAMHRAIASLYRQEI